MKKKDTRQHAQILRVSLLTLAFLVISGLSYLAFAQAPDWWQHRAVLEPGAEADDYALVNMGQVKNIANAAALMFDEALPGGAGGTLHNFVSAWEVPGPNSDDFAAVNVGQLKNLAKPFYDRLIQAGYIRFENGEYIYPWLEGDAQSDPQKYPWLRGGSTAGDNYLAINIGQVKHMFSFAPDIDTDSDGMADWWEERHGLSPNDPEDADGDPDSDFTANLDEFLQGSDPTVSDTFVPVTASDTSLWLKAAANTEINSSGFVSRWRDVDNRGLEAVQFSQVQRPLKTLIGDPTKFAISFTGTGEHLILTDPGVGQPVQSRIFGESESTTIIMTLELEAFPPSQDIGMAAFMNDNSERSLIFGFRDSKVTVWSEAGGDILLQSPTVYEEDELLTISFIFEKQSGNCELFVNGTQQAVDTSKTFHFTKGHLRLGSQANLMPYYGHLLELAVFPTNLNGAQRRSVEVLQRGLSIDAPKADSDGDGMPNAWEIHFGYDPFRDDSAIDTDNDGITAVAEYQAGLNPLSSDTDQDGQMDQSDSAPHLHNRYLQNLWVDDALPAGAVSLHEPLWIANAGFNTVSGSKALILSASQSQMDFEDATEHLSFSDTDEISLSVYLDPQRTPTTIALEFQVDGEESFAHGVFWGNRPSGEGEWINAGKLPYAGYWKELSLPASSADLGSKQVAGLSILTLGGTAYLDAIGSRSIQDSGDDQLPDAWEYVHFNGIEISSDTTNSDADSLTDLQEYLAGTDPNNADTDFDGIPDHLDPNPRVHQDLAADLWIDEELPVDAIVASENDKWVWESMTAPPAASGSKAHISGRKPGYHTHWFFTETDQLWVAKEETVFCHVYLNPEMPPESLQLSWYQTNRNTWTKPVVWGGEEYRKDGDRYYMGPLPKAGVWSLLQVPADLVGVGDIYVKGMAFAAIGGEVWWDAAGRSQDPDGDGMPTSWEISVGLNPAIDDGSQDNDWDGLSNYDEYIARTDPLEYDTDGDGSSDGREVAAGTDPLDPEDFPSGPGADPDDYAELTRELVLSYKFQHHRIYPTDSPPPHPDTWRLAQQIDDSSPLKNGGTLVSPASRGWIKWRRYLEMNYAGGSSTPSSSSLEIDDEELTISAWIQVSPTWREDSTETVPANQGEHMRIVSKKQIWINGSGQTQDSWTNPAGYELEYHPHHKRLAFIGNSVDWQQLCAHNLDLNTGWHHVAVTLDEAGGLYKGTMYVNGRPVPSVVEEGTNFSGYWSNPDIRRATVQLLNPLESDQAPLLVGHSASYDPVSQRESFAGHIDNLRIYRRALSREAMRTLYQLERAGREDRPYPLTPQEPENTDPRDPNLPWDGDFLTHLVGDRAVLGSDNGYHGVEKWINSARGGLNAYPSGRWSPPQLLNNAVEGAPEPKKAVRFDGVNDVMTLGVASPFGAFNYYWNPAAPTEFSILAVLRTQRNHAGQLLKSSTENSQIRGTGLHVGKDALRLLSYEGGRSTTVAEYEGEVDLTDWSIVSVNVTNDSQQLFINGAETNYSVSSPESVVEPGVIINEIAQESAPGQSEWIELLTTGITDFYSEYTDPVTSITTYDEATMDSVSGGSLELVFKPDPVWKNIPPGTVIVIYDGNATKWAGLPYDIFDPAGGLIVVSSTDPIYFDQLQSTWPTFTNPEAPYDTDQGSVQVSGPWNSSTGPIFFNYPETPDDTVGNTLYRQALLQDFPVNHVISFHAGEKQIHSDSNSLLILDSNEATPGIGNNLENQQFIDDLRQVNKKLIINEISQGPVNTQEEFVELVALEELDLRGWTLESEGVQLQFTENEIWKYVYPGTIITIYNGDEPGNFQFINQNYTITVPSDSSETYLRSSQSGVHWLSLADVNGDSVRVRDSYGELISAVSFNGSTAHTPEIGSLTPGYTAVYLGGSFKGSHSADFWDVSPISEITIGQGNNTFNVNWIELMHPTAEESSARGYKMRGPTHIGNSSFSGDIAELIITEGVLTDEDRALLEEDLAGRYGLDDIDSDGDGLPNYWERQYGLDPQDGGLPVGSIVNGADGDPDGDGLTNMMEFLLGSSPQNPDSDSDGATDSEEHLAGTDLANSDSDGDIMTDGFELKYGLNPLSNDQNDDPDGDGICNLVEYWYNSHPNSHDGDSDGMPDVYEIQQGLDPLNAIDAKALFAGRNGLTNLQQYQDPGIDSDNDGLSDAAEQKAGTDPYASSSDSDIMPDGWEVYYNLNPLVDDSATDKDNDGFTAEEEYQQGTNPLDFDTDDDGLGDKWEMDYGLDPRSNLSSLVGWWRADHLVSDNLVQDHSESRNTLRMKGPPPQLTAGFKGQAMQFDIEQSYASISSTAINEQVSGNSFTLSLRAKLLQELASGEEAVLWEQLTGIGSESNVTLSFKPDRVLHLALRSNGLLYTANINLNSEVNLNEWHTYTVVYVSDPQGSLSQIYFDKELVETLEFSTSPLDDSSMPFVVGNLRQSLHDGAYAVDDIRLFADALSSTEISRIADPSEADVDPASRQLDANRDLDNDGVSNLEEYANFTNPYSDDPEVNTVDTDGDGLSDHYELTTFYEGGRRTHPLLTDSDFDDLSDGFEVNPEEYPDLYKPEYAGYIFDPTTGDFDNDSINDGDELTLGTNPMLSDSDEDGLPDGWELKYSMNPISEPGTGETQLDPDEDGLPNIQEFEGGTNPLIPDNLDFETDSDNDGLTDYEENHIYESDPNNPYSMDQGVGSTVMLDGFIAGYSQSTDINLGTGLDTDKDGVPDDQEMLQGTNPLDPTNKTASFAGLHNRPTKVVGVYTDDQENEMDDILVPAAYSNYEGDRQQTIRSVTINYTPGAKLSLSDSVPVSNPTGAVRPPILVKWSSASGATGRMVLFADEGFEFSIDRCPGGSPNPYPPFSLPEGVGPTSISFMPLSKICVDRQAETPPEAKRELSEDSGDDHGLYLNWPGGGAWDRGEDYGLTTPSFGWLTRSAMFLSLPTSRAGGGLQGYLVCSCTGCEWFFPAQDLDQEDDGNDDEEGEPGDGDGELGCLKYTVSLGEADFGRSSGSLLLESETPSSLAIGNPNSLEVKVGKGFEVIKPKRKTNPDGSTTDVYTSSAGETAGYLRNAASSSVTGIVHLAPDTDSTLADGTPAYTLGDNANLPFKQIRGAEMLVQLDVVNKRSYKLNFYSLVNVGNKGDDGLYQLMGEPYKIISITEKESEKKSPYEGVYIGSRSSHSSGVPNKRTIMDFNNEKIFYIVETDIETSIETKLVYTYVRFNESTYYWEKNTNDGYKVETCLVKMNGCGRVEEYKILNSDGAVLEHKKKEFVLKSFGFALRYQTIFAKDPATGQDLEFTTEFTYYSSGRNAGEVRSIHYPNGFWEYRTYDSYGRKTSTTTPFLGTPYPGGEWVPNPAGTAGMETLVIDYPTASSSEAKRTEFQYTGTSLVAQKDIVEKPDEYSEAVYGGGTAALSVKYTYNGDHLDEEVYSEPKTSLFHDGSRVRYEYSFTDSNGQSVSDVNQAVFRVTTSSAGYFGQDEPMEKGTKTITRVNRNGAVVGEWVYDVDVTRTPAEFLIKSREVTAWDDRGRPTQVTYHDGTSETMKHSTHGLEWSTPRDLAEPDARANLFTFYYYDSLGNLSEVVDPFGVTTHKEYDVIGRLVKESRIGHATTQLDDQGQVVEVPGTEIIQVERGYNLGGWLEWESAPVGHHGLQQVQVSHTFPAEGGHRVEITYPDGGTSITSYHSDGKLKQVHGSAELPRRFEYGANLHETWVKEIALDQALQDTLETSTAFYDFAGREIRQEVLDEEGVSVDSKKFYNAQGQLWKEIDPEGVTMLYHYSPTTGALEHEVVDVDRNDIINFDGNDRISRSLTDYAQAHGTIVKREREWVWHTPEGEPSAGYLVNVTEVSLDGTQSWITQHGITTSMESTLPQDGQVVSRVIPPDTNYYEEETSYLGRPQTSRETNGTEERSLVSYFYDSHGRANEITSQALATSDESGTVTYSYYDDDSVASVKSPEKASADPSRLVTQRKYDKGGRLNRVVYPQTIDNDGTLYTPEANWEFYPSGLLKSKSGDEVISEYRVYDPQGRLLQHYLVDDGTNVQTVGYEYTPQRGLLDKVKRTHDPDSVGPLAPQVVAVDYDYDRAGRLKQRTWAREKTTQYAYDDAGDLQGITYWDDAAATQASINPVSNSSYNVIFDRDRLGRIQKVTDALGERKIKYQDSPTNSPTDLVKEQEFLSGNIFSGLTQHWRYDNYLRQDQISVKQGSTIKVQHTYTYDTNLARINTVTDDLAQKTAQYGYRPHTDLVTSINIGDTPSAPYQLELVRAYDNLHRLKKIGTQTGPLAHYHEYEYDDLHRRKKAQLGDSTYWDYLYNRQGFLSDAEQKDEATNATVHGNIYQYQYDQRGNLTEKVVDGETATYTPLSAETNQIASYTVTGGVDLSFVYDADGNETSDGTWEYQWDAENQMIAAEKPGDTRLEFLYDYQGNRVAKVKSTWTGASWQEVGTRHFLYNGTNLIAELDGSNIFQKSYLWGLDLSGSFTGSGGVGGLLAVTDLAGTLGTHLTISDGNGNITGFVDADDGQLVGERWYDPFGNITRQTGIAANITQIGFSSRWFDEETGFNIFRYRAYRPLTGRWLSQDPLGEAGGLNLYVYSSNDPIGRIDPLGLSDTGFDPLKELFGAIAGEAGELLYDTLRQWPQEFATEARNFAERQALGLAYGIRESLLQTADHIGFALSSAIGAGEHYEGNSDLYKSIAANPQGFTEGGLFLQTALGIGRMALFVATKGASELVMAGHQALKGNWEGAQDHSFNALLSAVGVRGAKLSVGKSTVPMRSFLKGVGAKSAGAIRAAKTSLSGLARGASSAITRTVTGATRAASTITRTVTGAVRAIRGSSRSSSRAIGAAKGPAGLTFRGDTRAPAEIFQNGFQARGSSTNLMAHALDNTAPPSAFISTSRSASVAGDFADSVYVVRPRGGIDVNATLGSRSPFPNELEIAVPHTISPFDIRGVTFPQQGFSTLNPSWKP